MKLLETKLDDFNISDITKKAIDKNGLGAVTFINAKVNQNNRTIELLFEVDSSVGDPKHVDMKGKVNDKLKHGYSSVVNFVDVTDEMFKGLSEGDEETFIDVLTDCDAKVHCDDPSFYWQGAHEEDSKKKNTRFGFQGTKGSGMWTLMHKDAGGKEGERLCKHLYAVKNFIIKNSAGMAKQIGKSFKYTETPEVELKQKANTKGNEVAVTGATNNVSVQGTKSDVSVQGSADNTVNADPNGEVKESLLLKYLR